MDGTSFHKGTCGIGLYSLLEAWSFGNVLHWERVAMGTCALLGMCGLLGTNAKGTCGLGLCIGTLSL